MWTLCASDLESYTQCKNTDKRSSSEAHIKDIFDALVKLDSINKLPSFVAKNLDQLPNRQPEELNLISIINRISKLEEKQTDFDNMLIKHEELLIKHNELQINPAGIRNLMPNGIILCDNNLDYVATRQQKG